MTIQHTSVDGAGRGVEYRVNPRDRVTVEKRVSHNRWRVVRVCATAQDARALLFRLAGGRHGGHALE